MNRKWKGIFTILFATVTVFTFSNRQTPTSTTVKSDYQKLQKVNASEPEQFSILLGGDVMLGRSVTSESLDRNKNPSYPFSKVESLFNEADLIFINLENPIVEKCPRRDSGFIFCAPPGMLHALTSHNTLVNLSNNHTLNYGEVGYTETIKHLGEQNIQYTDHETLYIHHASDNTFGFLGFEKSQQSKPKLTSAEQALVSESAKKVDVLFVAVHWGVEYQKHPLEGQRALAQELVTFGADVIVGHHPHWVQDREMIDNVPVYYSLGNFVFDQMWSEETRKGLLVQLTFENNKIVKEKLIPIYIQQMGQPIILP